MAAPEDEREKNDPLTAAHHAFERGDFYQTSRLAAELERTATDDATRAVARTLRERLAADPVVVALTAGCLFFFVLVVAFTLGR